MSNYVEISKVERKVFNRVSDRIKEDTELYAGVTVYYDGTSLYGTLRFESAQTSLLKKSLQILTEEFCG